MIPLDPLDDYTNLARTGETVRSIIDRLITTTLERLRHEGIFSPDTAFVFNVERPRDKNHGDFATNAALVLAKAARLPPRLLAEKIVAALPDTQNDVEKWEVAGPGFINFFLSDYSLHTIIPTIWQAGSQFGHSQIGAGRKIQVEFVSANPTGPMHLGHGRGAVTGDVIARLLQAIGCTVEREYYINDAGAQTLVLGRSVLIRYYALFGRAVTLPEGCYPAEYVVEIAQALRERDGDRWLAAELPAEPPPAVVDFAMAHCLGWIRDDLALLNIHFDTWFSERSLHQRGLIAQVAARLEEKGLIYEGILEPPKGKLLEEWEPRPQRLFRSSQFGDEVDRPLQKSDGTFTYFAADIAYHLDKAERNFDTLINIWGADHGGYIKRVQAALTALTGKPGLLEVRLVQMVNLFRGGQPVRMSKRSGTFVTLREVVEEAGSDAVRFWFLLRSAGANLDFDLELAMAKTNDNPIFYVQYAHARVHSVWRRLAEKGLPPHTVQRDQLARLTEPDERDLLRLLSRFPEVVENAALEKEPQKIPYYLLELAAAFHTYYNGHRILDEDADLRGARLSLIGAVGLVIANGLTLLGVHAPEQM
ncbi:MAG: arginine--tRNA ligase [Magnetococcales bacterium]|nr:arginine--tRNA ligase [Magnetococcales bacterium]